MCKKKTITVYLFLFGVLPEEVLEESNNDNNNGYL